MACNSKAAGHRLRQSEIFGLRDTSNTYMGQFCLHLLHYLSNQGYSVLQMSKLGFSHFSYIAIVATWLLGI